MWTLCLPYAGAVSAASPNPLIHVEFASDGERVIAAVLVDIPSGYHAYAHEPGDSGRPAVLDFSLAQGRPKPVYYPAGAMQRDYYDTTATVFVYEGRATFFVPLPGESGGLPYKLGISLLLCSAKNCLPFNQQLFGHVPDTPEVIETMSWGGRWREISLASVQLAEAAKDMSDDPAEKGAGTDSIPRFQPRYADDSLEITGWGQALLIGILAGLLLNAMPCVLPVLVLKVSGFFLTPGNSEKEQLRLMREHNLCFTAGILTFFTALALILGLADLMWGQLYQNEGIVLVLLVVIFLLGLSMLGVFTLPVVDFKFATKTKNLRLRFYLTGLLSTLLATPCSGPLLGGVLAWAFTKNLSVLMVVFWAIGLGMALPYLLLCVWPGMLSRLPKPGRWMLIFERVVGFLLLGTALYLLSILPTNKYPQILRVLLFIAFCAWFWGNCCDGAAVRRRLVGGVLFLAVLGATLFTVLQSEPPPFQRQTFNHKYFFDRLGKKNLLLEFTADWCPNCKFLEAVVLTDEKLKKWQERYNIEFIRVDITRGNAEASDLLEKLGSKSIPLTALFPAGEKAVSPMVLRDVYSVRHIEKTMDKIFLDGQ
ncbi:MAG: thioredoxin family protein [Desulfovibrio sp.]|nr:thioredoxin family protein [Desulfovibrio sp.]